ncbi:MAG: serine/threonine-protein kinase [Planctomycetota bacterium]|jgi:tetratricopeptide (TPR) repeat protein
MGGGSALAEKDLAGRSLGGYRIENRIGKGGGGTVYRAHSEAGGPAGPAGAVIALKVFHPELLEDENVFKRFQREAELGMKIRHPNVVETYQTGAVELDGSLHHFIAMELIEGETLREMLTELGTVPEDLLYSIGDQFLAALSAIHAEGMIHRDVKPENIVVTSKHELKLMDLGVARLQQEGRDLTRAGEFVGSRAYASPEQFMDQDHVGPPADIYAFGVLLYEMSTGVNPYDISDLGTLLSRKMRGQVRRPKVVNRDLDPFLDDVIQVCLQSEPSARFATCNELREILAQREASEWWTQRTRGEAYPAATRALRRLRPPRDAPLSGRSSELERLHQAFERAAGGHATLALVAGSAGVGKSRLVHDFCEELVAPEGPILLVGRCAPSAALAHHPFREAIEDYSPARAAELSGDFVPAFTALLKKLAAQRPVLLVLEDFQHADPESTLLLEHLARSLDDQPVLLAVTWRPDDLDEGSSLQAALMPREGWAAVELEPLTRDAAEQLLAALLVHPRTVRSLAWPAYKTSGGNPRFLLEVVAHLKETGALVAEDGGWINARPVREVALPTDTRDLLAIRVRGLDDELRATIDAAAVLGDEFDASLLAAASGQKRIRLLKKLALLERKHRLLVSSGKNAFRFASHGLQRVIYDAIDREERKRIHSVSADALREQDEEMIGPRAQLWVRHMMRAERLSEASEQITVAIEHAATHDHGAEAVGFLEELLVALDPDDLRLRFDTSMLLAALHGPLGHLDDQRRALARAAGEAEGMSEPGPLARVQAAFAGVSVRSGNHDRAEAEAMQGLMLAGRAKDAECEAQCLHMLGVIAARRGDFARAADYLRDALGIRRAVGDRRGEASTLVRLGAIMPEIGEGDTALETKRAALEILQEIGDRRGEGATLSNVGNALVDADRIQEALVCYEQSVRIAREFGDLPSEAAALHNIARVLTIENRIDEAKETFERALDIFRQIGDPSGEAEVLDELGSAVATFGDREEAVRCLESAREAAVRHGEFPLLARVLRHLGTLRHEAGEREEGWQLFERALGLARHQTRSAILADMGAAAEREGDFDRAADLLQESLKGAEGRRRTILSLCRLARAHHHAGRTDEAVSCAHRAEQVIEGEHAVVPHHGPEVYYSLGTVLSDEARGAEYLRRANDLLGERTRAIRSVIYRDHYLTMRWPNREIIEETRRLVEG